MTQQQQQALAQIAQASVAAERATGCPAELSAAQCILESGWLSRCPDNNCFGIMPDHHGAGVQYFISREFLDGAWVTKQEAFEKYDTLADCFADHARLIQQGAYLPAWQQYQKDHDLDALIAGIAKHYATAPDYAKQVASLASAPYVSIAVQAARQKAMNAA